VDANTSEISRNSNKKSIFLLLKRLNKGNTLIEGCLSTTDLNESIFKWSRGNRGRRNSHRHAACLGDQTIGCRMSV
jgi:hypothetical protein